jgi:hypothetical protein
MKTSELTVMDEKIDKFGGLIQCIGSSLVSAGKLLVEIIEEDPTAKRRIQAKYPEISASMLNQLEAVGRGQLHPKLALTGSAGYMRLRGLPMSDQERYLEESVELLVEAGEDYDVLLVKVSDLTPKQAAQVFAPDHVRAQGAQRAYLEDQKQKATLAHRCEELPEPYKVHRDGSIEFRAGTRIKRKELLWLVQRVIGEG